MNVFRSAGDKTHLPSVLVLLLKLHTVKSCAGLLEEVHWSVLKQLLLLCSLLSFSDAKLRDKMLEREAVSPATLLVDAPAMPELPLPAKLGFFHKPHGNHLNPYGAPAQPPNYGHFVISAPPPNSGLSKPSMEKSGTVPASASIPPPHLAEISPAQPEPSTLPAGLAQPPLPPGISNCCGPDMVLKRGSHGCHCVYPIKLDILLLNVSSNPNWNLFLEQFASQLGLRVSQIELINFYMVSISGLNISMDITPHTGISFSASEAAGINSSLSAHKVHLDPALVGDYQLLNITWFKPPLLPQAPVSNTSPTEAPPNLPSTPAALVTSKKVKRPSLVLVIGLGAIILIVAVISVVILCFCISRQEKHSKPFKETAKQRSVEAIPAVGSLRCPTSTRFLTYEELKEATNNFEPGSILGEGGFGRVFKGVLSDGTAVAIKRLSSGGQQGDKEFLVEVEMLSRLHHRNLVKLVGYYSNRDSSQNLLCYELVPNGSLEAWLHGPLGLNCPLDWDTRMKIALDAARGLAYLHEDSQPCVIHRDFKASNILLENNFHAKVSDFGLAKQAPEGRANYLSTRVMGTFGYVAPEYAMTGHLLVKSDVYSYGVVLLELLTGRTPVDMSQPSGQENLVTWARPILRDKDRLEELADPRLEGKYPKEDFFRVCTIAAACVAPEASQRPTMGEVVQSLKMVQRIAEYHDSAVASNTAPNLRQSSTTFESDGTSSIFSSGPYSGLSAFENDHISRTAVFSEDLQEGR
ncbi:receptor-like serine/threonine-protein kinase ALE2 isoform X2 [Sesamum indicum]|uniref:Receptor-like serine/threonine-protein kinase ALE2 isoform X2 n=1 Tax=Sesamum indicum TaxID=4182 RepID=A0A6I9U1X9_SESIN|nr:receptor-like serine/threonine-protein kinase ALE2 isoform X2 [Sesamum indicum]